MPYNLSSSVIPFSCLQSFPASGSFPVSQFFALGGQSIGLSASASVLPMNIQDWFPLRWTGLSSLQSKGLSGVFSNTAVQKHQFFSSQLSLRSNSHPYMTTGKTIALIRQTFVGKVTSLFLICCPGFNSTWKLNFQMFKLDLEKAEEPEIKLPTFTGSSKSNRVPENHLLLLYWLCQRFDCVHHTNCGKFWKRWEYQTTWPASWEICMQVRK